LDVALGNPIVMMGTDASKESLLIELEDVLGEGLRCEVGSVVEEVLGWNHTGVSAHEFKGLLRLERFRRAERSLQFNVDVSGGRVHKDAASLVHLVLLGLAAATEQSASSSTNEVVDRDLLPWK
jgi:selenophosphate synthetase-related protein